MLVEELNNVKENSEVLMNKMTEQEEQFLEDLEDKNIAMRKQQEKYLEALEEKNKMIEES